MTLRLLTRVWIEMSSKAECCLAIACFTSLTLISLNLSLESETNKYNKDEH